MNEEYLLGAYNSFGGQEKLGADFETWTAKIKDNESYKQGMFNSFGGQKKLGATYEDWNTKIFQGEPVKKKDETQVSSESDGTGVETPIPSDSQEPQTPPTDVQVEQEQPPAEIPQDTIPVNTIADKAFDDLNEQEQINYNELAMQQLAEGEAEGADFSFDEAQVKQKALEIFKEVEPPPVQHAQVAIPNINSALKQTDTVLPTPQSFPQKDQDLIDAANSTDDVEEQKSFFAQLLPSFELGSVNLGVMMSSLPETLYEAAAYPQNGLAALTGWKGLEASPDKFKKELGVTNPVLDFYVEEKNRLAEQSQKFKEENYESSSVTEEIGKGNIGDALELLALNFTESLAVSLSMMAGGAVIGSASRLAAVSTPLFQGGERDDMQQSGDFDDMSEFEKTTRAFGSAGAETIFAAINTTAMTNAYKSILAKEGKQVGTEVFKKSLIEMYTAALKKYGIAAGALGEGLEEVATQATQNMIKGKPFAEGAGDAFFNGVFGGGVFATPITVSNTATTLKDGMAEYEMNKVNKESAYDDLVQPFVNTTGKLDETQLELAAIPRASNVLTKKLDKQVKSGDITAGQAKETLANFDKVYNGIQATSDIGLKPKDQIKAIDLLDRKQKLAQQIEGKDKALTTKQQNEITDINTELETIANPEAVEETVVEETPVVEQTAEAVQEPAPVQGDTRTPIQTNTEPKSYTFKGNKSKGATKYTVTTEDGVLVVKDPSGKKPSNPTVRDVLSQHTDGSYFPKGKVALTEKNREAASANPNKFIADNSENPSEIAEAILTGELDVNENTKDPQTVAIAEGLRGGGVNRDSFIAAADKPEGVPENYFKDVGGKTKTMDRLVLDINSNLSEAQQIDADDIATFMKGGIPPKEFLEGANPVKQQLIESFEVHSGVKATDTNLQKAVDQKNRLEEDFSLVDVLTDDELVSLDNQRTEFEKTTDYEETTKPTGKNADAKPPVKKDEGKPKPKKTGARDDKKQTEKVETKPAPKPVFDQINDKKFDLAEQANLNKLDSWIENLDKDITKFGKENLSMGLPLLVAKGVVKAMRAASLTAKTGADVISAGVNALKQSEWYKGLSKAKQKDVIAKNISKTSPFRAIFSALKTEQGRSNTLKTKIQNIKDKAANEQDARRQIKEFVQEQMREQGITDLNSVEITTLLNQLDKLPTEENLNHVANLLDKAKKRVDTKQKTVDYLKNKVAEITKNAKNVAQAQKEIGQFIQYEMKQRGIENVSASELKSIMATLKNFPANEQLFQDKLNDAVESLDNVLNIAKERNEKQALREQNLKDTIEQIKERAKSQEQARKAIADYAQAKLEVEDDFTKGDIDELTRGINSIRLNDANYETKLAEDIDKIDYRISKAKLNTAAKRIAKATKESQYKIRDTKGATKGNIIGADAFAAIEVFNEFKDKPLVDIELELQQAYADPNVDLNELYALEAAKDFARAKIHNNAAETSRKATAAKRKQIDKTKTADEKKQLRLEAAQTFKEQVVNKDIAWRLARQAADQLDAIITEGKTELKEKIAEEAARLRFINENAKLSSVNPNSHMTSADVKKNEEARNRFVNWYKKGANSFNILTSKSITSSFEFLLKFSDWQAKWGKGFMYDYFYKNNTGTRIASQKSYKENQAHQDNIRKKISQIFDIKDSPWSIGKFLDKSSNVIVKSGVYITKNGKQVQRPMSKSNAMFVYLMSKQEGVKLNLAAAGYNQNSIEQVEKFLGKNYLELADQLSEYMQDNFDDYNEVYEGITRARINQVDNYFPIKYVTDELRQEVDLEGGISGVLKAMIPSHAIERVTNVNAIDDSSNAMGMWFDYMQEMTHFKHYARVTKDLNSVLSNPEFKKNVERLSIEDGITFKMLKDAAQAALGIKVVNPNTTQGRIEKFLYNLSKGIAVTYVGFKSWTGLKQVISALAALNEADNFFVNINGTKRSIPLLGGAKMVGRLAIELPRGFSSIKFFYNNSIAFQKRIESGDAGSEHIDNFLKDPSRYSKAGSIKRYITNASLFVNRKMDAFTIAWTGRAIYQQAKSKYKKAGISETEANKMAMKDFEIYMDTTQQSSNAETLGEVQRNKGAIGALFTPFKNSVFAYWRKISGSYFDLTRQFTKEKLLIQGQGTQNQNEKAARAALRKTGVNLKAIRKTFGSTQAQNNITTMALYGYVMPLAWQWVASGLPALLTPWTDDDDEEMKRALIFGYTDGLFIVNDAGKWIYDVTVRGKNWQYTPSLIINEMNELGKQVAKIANDEGLVSLPLAITTVKAALQFGGIVDADSLLRAGGGFVDLYYALNELATNGELNQKNIQNAVHDILVTPEKSLKKPMVEKFSKISDTSQSNRPAVSARPATPVRP